MPTPIIENTGSLSGVGATGEGRSNLIPGETISLSDAVVANSGAAYFWEFDDTPIGTAPVLTGATTATPSFIVDADAALAGSYRVRCTVNGSLSSVEVFSVPLLVTGGRIPSFQEETEYDGAGNLKGWHEALTTFMRTSDEDLGVALGAMIQCGGRESHNSDTPLVVGSFAFNPTTYTSLVAGMVFKLRVVAANGTTPLTTHVKLRNLTDAEDVTSSVINIVNSTSPTKYEATLVVGAAAGMIKNSGEKIYECRIYLDVPAVDPDVDTIELYKAELIAVFTP